MIWHIHRHAGAIVSAHQEKQPGYADEALDDSTSNELQTFLQAAGAADQSIADNLGKALEAILYAAGGMAGKSPAESRQAYRTAWQALPPTG